MTGKEISCWVVKACDQLCINPSLNDLNTVLRLTKDSQFALHCDALFSPLKKQNKTKTKQTDKNKQTTKQKT